MSKIKPNLMLLGLAAIAIWYMLDCGTALAASDDSMRLIDQGTGMDTAFDNTLKDLAKGFVLLSRIIGVCMTGAGILMYFIGLEQFPKMAFNWILGIGLAMNFGSVLMAIGVDQMIAASGGGAHTVPPLQVDLKQGADGPTDILSQTFNYIKDQVVLPGSRAVLPIALKLLVILTIIQASYDVAFKLISGDKIKYLISVVVKFCIIVFIEQNWLDGMNLMGALSHGFEALGYAMSNAGLDLSPDSIVNNGMIIFNMFWPTENDSIGIAGAKLVITILTVGLLLVTAVDMFMARMEFYLMAMMVMPLLPFMITSKFSFLSDKAIGLMLNLAIKVCTIACMTGIMVPFFNAYIKDLQQAEGVGDSLVIMLQVFLASLLMYLLTKNISNIVSGLLSGQPSLGGSMMTAQLKNTAKNAVDAGASVATGGASFAGRAGAAYRNNAKFGKGMLRDIGLSYMNEIGAIGGLKNAKYSGAQSVTAARQGKTVTMFLDEQRKQAAQAVERVEELEKKVDTMTTQSTPKNPH